MSDKKRTPGPWRHGTPTDGTCEKCFIDGSDHRIAEVFCKRELQKSGEINTGEGIRNVNAIFIVKACNSHDRLVEALKEISDKKKWGYLDDSGCPKGHGEYTNSWVDESHPIDIALKALREAGEEA